MLQELTPLVIIGIIFVYFALLLTISYFTGRNADNAQFFNAGRQNPWWLVAIGMIGASISGVTFVSIPGVVGADGLNKAFSYMQVVLGYLVGYFVIATVLMPLYYRLNLTSIYGYLGKRFGRVSYKTGAGFFMLSRTIGSAFRLYLVAMILQEFVMDYYGVPFIVTVIVTILLIWAYTLKGGVKTIVWTDSLQALCFILAVILTVGAIAGSLETNFWGLVDMVRKSEYSQVFFFEGGWSDPNNFFKQFLSGALITIVMTGLDQDMMQKNLSCRNIREAQKNMFSFSVVLIFVNLLFLTLGAALYLYASHVGLDMPEKTDQLYPTIALQHLSPFVGILFVLGLIAAAYSSADSALTALTTSFCIDFLDFETWEASEEHKQRVRVRVHIGISVLLILMIVLFNIINNEAVISNLFVAAGYTYGPLLGLFAFGISTNRHIRDNFALPVCLASPILSFLIDHFSGTLLGGFQFGFLIIALNGLLTYLGLWAISYPAEEEA